MFHVFLFFFWSSLLDSWEKINLSSLQRTKPWIHGFNLLASSCSGCCRRELDKSLCDVTHRFSQELVWSPVLETSFRFVQIWSLHPNTKRLFFNRANIYISWCTPLRERTTWCFQPTSHGCLRRLEHSTGNQDRHRTNIQTPHGQIPDWNRRTVLNPWPMSSEHVHWFKKKKKKQPNPISTVYLNYDIKLLG